MIPTKTTMEIINESLSQKPRNLQNYMDRLRLGINTRDFLDKRWVSVDVLRQKLQQRINELDKTIGITKSFADSRIEELEQLLVMLESEEAKK